MTIGDLLNIIARLSRREEERRSFDLPVVRSPPITADASAAASRTTPRRLLPRTCFASEDGTGFRHGSRLDILYDPTPWFLLFLEVARRPGRAIPNELLTSDLGRWSTPTVPQLPNHPPPRHSSSSARAPRCPVFGRYGDGAAVSERGGARRRTRSRTEAVSLPGDCAWHILPSCARAGVGE